MKYSYPTYKLKMIRNDLFNNISNFFYNLIFTWLEENKESFSNEMFQSIYIQLVI
jgi:hypothetical protein